MPFSRAPWQISFHILFPIKVFGAAVQLASRCVRKVPLKCLFFLHSVEGKGLVTVCAQPAGLCRHSLHIWRAVTHEPVFQQ
uniref:Secreted protein n=1 Tax=Anguilla anguilla TaxID=7936 RepID=A0A0E9UC66_ANGAN